LSLESSQTHRRLFVLMIAAFLGAVSSAVVALAQKSSGGDAASYWHLPLAAQGAAPDDWSEIERSLSPADCGQCHVEQFEQWGTSKHAHSFSAGFVGQILVYDVGDRAECLQCHAPLAEQRAAFEQVRNLDRAGVINSLAAGGVSCGSCHLRANHRFGPPERGTGALGPSALNAPHGGFLRTKLFENSEFCSACHQFPASFAVNGKPLENTFVEWQNSPQAAHGIVCQTCPMPDRQHLWRGIHDPAMVASSLTPHVTADAKRIRFELTNTGVGHAFPTYITPKAIMYVVALDAAGAPRPETLRSHELVRKVRWQNDRWVELSDTRLFPGQSAAIEFAWNGNDRAEAWMEVFPDYFYENEVFPGLLNALPPNGGARQLISKAATNAAASHFRLFDTDLRRP
jgi:hypothetical protein